MKQLCRRGLALLTVFVLLISLLPSITFTSDAASYTYNWGTRGEVATSLSSAAKAWYSTRTSYEVLSTYSGASSTSSVPSSALYDQLKTLMKNAHSNINSYGDVKTLAKYTDCQNGGGAISSFYSGNAVGPSWDGSWNREHTWPNSKGLGGSDEDDIMMIRPTSYSENSGRGNTAYGESSGYYNPNSESGGKYDLRGDCARICLYVYVRWGNTSKMWGASGVMESKSVLLKWMEEDPVDTWELGRNDSVQSITGTRNVFVDYPELAFLLFNEQIPAEYDSPSGGTTASYTVSATSNNTSYGTVSVQGNVITATAKTGYYVAGYTVTKGSATVTQSGNTFTVVPMANCTVQINFAAKTTVTVNFSGASVSSKTGYAGETMTLPTVTAPEGYQFLGWMEYALTDETTQKPVYYTNSYIPRANTTLYALYSYKIDDGNGASDEFSLYSEELTEGDYVIVSDKSALVAADADSSGRLDYATVTISNNTIKNPAATLIWHIAPDGAYWTIYNEENAVYAAGTGSKNKAAPITSLTDYGRWTATGSGSYEFKNLGNANKSVNALLRCNGTYGFACYSSSTGSALSLYKAGSGSTTYYTNQTGDSCDHDYEEVTVEPTCTTAGYTTYTCSVCGESYVADRVDALGHTEVVDAAVSATCTETGLMEGSHCGTCHLVLTAQTVIPAAGHDEAEHRVEPTLTQMGYTQIYCSACGEELNQVEFVPCLASVEGWSMVLSDHLTVKFVVYLEAETAKTAQITVSVADSTVFKGSAVFLTAAQQEDRYYVTVDLAAAQMADVISITVTNGTDSRQDTGYTVQKYANEILADENQSQYHQLVKEMLNYGAAAQTFFGYNDDNMVDSGEDAGAENVPETTDAIAVSGRIDGAEFYGASIVYRNRLAVRFYFTGDVSEYIFYVEEAEYQAMFSEENEMYYVEVADILPQDLDRQITLTAMDAEGNTLSVTYGPMNYIVRMSRCDDEDLKALLKALYNYHLAAKAV